MSTDIECASQAMCQAGRSGEAYTQVPTRRFVRAELITSEPHVVVDSERRVFPYAVLEEQEVSYRVGLLVSDFLLVPYLVARGGGVALLRYRVAAEMRTLVDLRIEEAPFRLPGLGIDMVFNPHLADQYFMAWLRQLLFEAALPE